MKTDATKIIKNLNRAGYEAYLVGGCVRDELARMPIKDWDIATCALPDQVQSVFYGEQLLSVGKAFGILMLVRNGVSYEIATYRGSDKTKFCDKLETDAGGRDFTINAIYKNVDTGEIIDPFNGKADIKNRTIRCVKDPLERFLEDELRMLRAIRFAVQKNFQIEEHTFSAIKENAHLISRVAQERTRQELTKIITSERPGLGLKLLRESNLLLHLLPEVDALDGAKQNPSFHPEGDVFVHTVNALDECRPNTPLIRWALLLHDTGKIKSERIIEGGRISHGGHEDVSERLAEEILLRFGFDKRFISDVCWLVKRHGVFIGWSNQRSRIQKIDIFINPLFAQALLPMYFADRKSSRDENISNQAANTIARIKAEYLEFKNNPDGRYEQAIKFTLVTGDDLKDDFKGPEIGKILKELRAFYLVGNAKDRKELLGYLDKKYIQTRRLKQLKIDGNVFVNRGLKGAQIGRALKRSYELLKEGEGDPGEIIQKAVEYAAKA